MIEGLPGHADYIALSPGAGIVVRVEPSAK
jgi:hypothetical protein